VLLLRADSGEVVFERREEGTVSCVALSPDGRTLAWAALDQWRRKVRG